MLAIKKFGGEDKVELAQFYNKYADGLIQKLMISNEDFLNLQEEVPQDAQEEKKRIAFLKEPLYKDMSYAMIAFFIMDKVDELVEKALRLQQSRPKDDIHYIAVGKLAFEYATNVAGAWHNYAPDAAELPINIGDQKDVGLWISVKSEVEEQLLRLDLPEELKKQLVPEKNNNENPGCLGSIAILAISVSSLLLTLIS